MEPPPRETFVYSPMSKINLLADRPPVLRDSNLAGPWIAIIRPGPPPNAEYSHSLWHRRIARFRIRCRDDQATRRKNNRVCFRRIAQFRETLERRLVRGKGIKTLADFYKNPRPICLVLGFLQFF